MDVEEFEKTKVQKEQRIKWCSKKQILNTNISDKSMNA